MAERQIDPDGLNRQVCLEGIRKFCENEGFSVPPLAETPIDGGVMLSGRSPDGREFRLGYEHDYIYPLWAS